MSDKGMSIEETIRWLKTINQRIGISDGQMDNIFHVTIENAVNFLEIDRHAKWINESLLERKTGEWIDEPYKQYPAYSIRHCSNCGWSIHKTKLRDIDQHWQYCPNCGAEMTI